jgi:hypothetical protein
VEPEVTFDGGFSQRRQMRGGSLHLRPLAFGFSGGERPAVSQRVADCTDGLVPKLVE